MRTDLVMLFCMNNYICLSTVKLLKKLPVVYATDRSDAVVLVLFLFCFVLLFTTGCYIVLGLLFGIVCVCVCVQPFLPCLPYSTYLAQSALNFFKISPI